METHSERFPIYDVCNYFRCSRAENTGGFRSKLVSPTVGIPEVGSLIYGAILTKNVPVFIQSNKQVRYKFK